MKMSPLVVRILCLWLLACRFAGAAEPANDIDWTVFAVLNQPAVLDAERLGTALQSQLTTQDRYMGADSQNGAVVLRFGRGQATLTVKEAPLPTEEWKEACRQAAWYWRGGCEALAGHQAHVRIVMAGTDMKKVDSAVLLTRILAIVVEQTGAVAALWGASLQSHDAFLKSAAEMTRDRVPATLWVNYQLSREPSGNVTIMTRGLRAFDLMEIEGKDVRYPGRDLMELLLQTSQRLISKGPVIDDGDTIGRSPAGRLYLKYADSIRFPGRRVYRVEMGN